jgi:hypothetical protein
MSDLTKKQLDRQGLVDNAIRRMLDEVYPNKKPVDWSIEHIGNVRDAVVEMLLEHKLCTEKKFCP